MKSLKNCIKLSCSVKIYIPSTINVNQEIDNEKYVNLALSFLSSKFGGATSSPALGAWVSSKGDLVKESVTLAFSYATQEQLNASIEDIYAFCLDLKKNLSQEAIALEVNNELYLV